MKKRILLFCLLALFNSSQAIADQATIAVASNFIRPMKELIEQFHQQSPHQIRASYASSGKIYSQITHGAPYDLFFSADLKMPQKLVNQQLAIESSLAVYATGRLVLWSKKPNQENLKEHLLNSQFNKLAIANRKLAPYGEAAHNLLTSLKLVDATQEKWIVANNIAQTFQFVASGNVDLGLVALSQIMRHGEITQGSAWLIPNDLYTPVKQQLVLLARAEQNIAAMAFLEYIKSEQAKQIMRKYGYLF